MSDDDRPLPDGFGPPGAIASPFTIRQPVAWGELDAYGHVNNVVYLRWFETVRFHYFEVVGIGALWAAERKGPILARTEVDFRAPVRFPDELLSSMVVTRIGRSSVTMRNALWSTRDERLCAEATSVAVFVDYAAGGRPIAVPEAVRAAIRALEGPAVES
jgi:acyl-CoA thioester hydrolase